MDRFFQQMNPFSDKRSSIDQKTSSESKKLLTSPQTVNGAENYSINWENYCYVREFFNNITVIFYYIWENYLNHKVNYWIIRVIFLLIWENYCNPSLISSWMTWWLKMARFFVIYGMNRSIYHRYYWRIQKFPNPWPAYDKIADQYSTICFYRLKTTLFMLLRPTRGNGQHQDEIMP